MDSVHKYRTWVAAFVAVVLLAMCGLGGCAVEAHRNVLLARAGLHQQTVQGSQYVAWVRADTCRCDGAR